MTPGTVVSWRALSNPAVVLSGVVVGTRGGLLVVDTDPGDPWAGMVMIEPERVTTGAV